MKTIAPITIWKDGELKTANFLQCFISYDDLSSSAIFGYRLFDEEPPQVAMHPSMLSPIATGEVSISGTDYENWDDSNDAAYAYVAAARNITIVSQP